MVLSALVARELGGQLADVGGHHRGGRRRPAGLARRCTMLDECPRSSLCGCGGYSELVIILLSLLLLLPIVISYCIVLPLSLYVSLERERYVERLVQKSQFLSCFVAAASPCWSANLRTGAQILRTGAQICAPVRRFAYRCAESAHRCAPVRRICAPVRRFCAPVRRICAPVRRFVRAGFLPGYCPLPRSECHPLK